MRTFFRPLVWAALVTCACAPDLSTPNGRAVDPPYEEPSATPPPFSVALEPPASLDAAPRVLRIHVRAMDGSESSPDAFHLIRGELSPAQLKQVGTKPLPKTLAARAVALQRWRSTDGLVLAPTVALAAGGAYSIVGPRQLLAIVRVVASDEIPTLSMIWPIDGRSPTGLLAVWCGDRELAPVSSPVRLDPAGIAGVLRSGIAPADSSRRCLHFAAGTAGTPGEPAPGAGRSNVPLLAPVLAISADGQAIARLEPRPLVRDDTPLVAEPALACQPGVVQFAKGCARVEDDRLLLQTPATPLLWSVQAAKSVGLERVWTSDGGSLYLWPLAPQSSVGLAVATIDHAGAAQVVKLNVKTKAAMPHVVVNEVMVNPIGPEPQQEWIELYNDGLAPAWLLDWRVQDIGGEAKLPGVVLPPGGYALIVNDDYDATAKHDPAPAPGCLLVRVPKLANGGLSNDGEAIDLIDPSGALVSQFPAIDTKKAGRSAYRVDPKSLYDFAASETGGSTPGASNAPNK